MKRPSQLAFIIVGALIAIGIILVRAIPSGMRPSTPSADASAAIRPPAVADSFYPVSPVALRTEVERYVREASSRAGQGELVALIVPHAGYRFSGPVAGYAYRLLQGQSYDTVVVVGPSHRMPLRGAALSGADQWATPLGRVQIDLGGTQALAQKCASARVFDAAHSPEHSIEVQLPFLQVVLGQFKLLPLLMSDFSKQNCTALAEALAEWARGRRVLLIASTDMSHYPPYDDAVRVDRKTLKAIATMDPGEVAATTKQLMSQGVPGLSTCLCGEGPVKVVLEACQLLGADRVEVLRYANSGDAPQGPRHNVVGYCAVAIYRMKGGSVRREEGELNAEQQRRLLWVARGAIEEYVRSGRVLKFEEDDAALLRPGAAFVTLTKNGMLRGCIGSLEPDKSLVETVRTRAIDASVRDRRFEPVRPEELPELEIEVSVLSPVRRVESADEIDITRHGVIVERGTRRGVFLPQVAKETGWSREELLSHLCREKAGLPADAWRKGAALYVFTVQAFSSPAPGEETHVGH